MKGSEHWTDMLKFLSSSKRRLHSVQVVKPSNCKENCMNLSLSDLGPISNISVIYHLNLIK